MRIRTYYFILSLMIIFHTSSLRSEDSQNKSQTQQDEKFICLVITIENDEQVIESCLKSVKDIVDCVCFCDRGSTDKTVEIASQLIRKSKIPSKVNKQENNEKVDHQLFSIQAAQEMIGELDFPLSNTYLLFLDADKILTDDSNFKKKNLSHEAYLILHHSLDMFFYRPCIFQASLPSEKIKKLSECLPFERPFPYKKITELVVNEQLEDPYQTEKITKNINNYIQILKDEPDNTHYMLSLAQSYKSLKKYQEAINWHKAFIKNCGCEEGIWFSNYKIAECYKELKRWDLALLFYLEAFQHASDRHEPLKKISEYYRLNHQHEIAYIYAKHASNLQFLNGHYLFVFNPIDTHQIDEELSIIAYYTQHKDEGYAAINRLLLNKDVPQRSKVKAYKNILYYIDKLENTHLQPISIQLPPIHQGSSITYNLMNSSIKRNGNGYKMICRTVNYTQFKGADYKPIDPKQNINTINYLLNLDHNLNVMSQDEIINDIPRRKTHYRVIDTVDGMEDCRQIHSGSEDWFTCTTYDTNPTGYLQVTLCKLSDQVFDHIFRVEKFTPLKGPNLFRHEKNWLPFMLNDDFHAIYSCDPLIIYKINRDTGKCEETHHIETTHDFSQFRGSAGPIEFSDGYLVLIHEVVFETQRNYIHRFLYLDNNFVAKKISKPFVFMHQGIEFCCGMTIDHAEKNLILAVSIEDSSAYTCTVDLETINRLLEPLTEISK
ncbi:MAG TPA: glycosyltransferase family 2 protein [Parachlamydiaceae bacterium]|nr:glycosyltransferase family 2 protein [Parachlamydiaceae bacterium]